MLSNGSEFIKHAKVPPCTHSPLFAISGLKLFFSFQCVTNQRDQHPNISFGIPPGRQTTMSAEGEKCLFSPSATNIQERGCAEDHRYKQSEAG